MNWGSLDATWQECFRLGWTSFINDETAIGAVITDGNGRIISKGRNSQRSKASNEIQIAGNQICHAEMNAILGLYALDVSDYSDLTLYTTTEPCPMCYGTYIMSDLRNMVFAARDPFAGSSNMQNTTEYLKRKSARHILNGPIAELEEYQMILSTIIQIRYTGRDNPCVIARLKIFPNLLEKSERLMNDKTFNDFAENKVKTEKVFNFICTEAWMK